MFICQMPVAPDSEWPWGPVFLSTQGAVPDGRQRGWATLLLQCSSQDLVPTGHKWTRYSIPNRVTFQSKLASTEQNFFIFNIFGLFVSSFFF